MTTEYTIIPNDNAAYFDLCLRAIEKGQVTAELYRTGAVVSGWPSRGTPCRVRHGRGVITDQSPKSLIRAGWKIENSLADWGVMTTLTFQQKHPDPKACLRRWVRKLGLHSPGVKYCWVQEYQARGVVHFHFLTELKFWSDKYCCGNPVPTRYVTRKGRHIELIGGHVDIEIWSAWLDASEQRADAALKFNKGGISDVVREGSKVGKYMGKYCGKAAQKQLPDGECPQGRWWFVSDAAQPMPRAKALIERWPYTKPHALVFDASELNEFAEYLQ